MENRWKVAGAAMVVAAVLAVGAAAQHQLSNTSLAISVPLQELVAAASSNRFSSLAQVSQGANSAEGVLEASLDSTSNEEFRLTPVKLTQTGPADFPDEASEDPGTLNLEADDPFFIVDGASGNRSPGGDAGTPDEADITFPNDLTEDPSLTTVIPPDVEDFQAQHQTSNPVDDLGQNASPPDDANTIEHFRAAENRNAKTNEGVFEVGGNDSILPPLTEDFVAQAEQSLDAASEDVIPKSSPVNTPSLEEQFEGPADFSQVDDPLPTEMLDLELSTGVIDEETLLTEPSPTDFLLALETPSEGAEPGSVSFLEKPTPEPVFAEAPPANLSPAPVPVRISLDDPTLAPIPEKIILEGPAPDHLNNEVPEGTAPERGREQQATRNPETIPETGDVDSGLQEIVDTIESSGDNIHVEPHSDVQIPGTEPTVAAQRDSFLDPAGTAAIPTAEGAAHTQLPPPGTQDKLMTELNVQSPPPGTQGRLVTELNVQSLPPGNQDILVTELTPQSPPPVTQDRLVTEINDRSPLLGTEESLVTEAEALTASADAGRLSEPQFGAHPISGDTVLLVEGLPEGDGSAPEDAVDPFAPEIENFNLDPPIDAQELAVVPEWIADDPVSGVIFDHSEVDQDPALPMDNVEEFFVAEDPQAEDQEKAAPGATVTEVKQQLQEDEVHIAPLPDAVPFSPAEVHLSQEMHDAVRDAIHAQIAAMDVFGMKMPVQAEAAPPAPLPPPPPPPSPPPPPPPPRPLSPTVDFTPDLAPVLSPNPPPEQLTPAPAPAPAPTPVRRPAPQPSTRPPPVKIQEPPAPAPPVFESSYFSTPAPAPVIHTTAAPKPARPAYRPRPKPTRPTYAPAPKPTRPTYAPAPKPTRPAYRPRPKPTRPSYHPQPKPTHPTYRPPRPSKPAALPPKAPPATHPPGRPPMSYFHIQEPKPEHFKPPSHHGSTHRPPPSSHDANSPHARPRPHPRPRPNPPSHKPPPPATYAPPRPTYRPRPAAHYKPPTTTTPPSSYHRPAPRPKPSYGTRHKDTPITTAKPHYRPTQATHKPPKAQKPILAPLLVPVDLHSIVIPKGVPSFVHRKPRPPSPFHIPFFFRTERKQRLQVPESVKSRLDSDQPEWVADLEPKRR